MVSRKRKTTIIIKLPPSIRYDFDRFMERLGKIIYGETMVAEVEGDTLRISLYGGKLSAERTLREIRKLVKEYSIRGKKTNRYMMKALAKEAKTAIPGDVVEAVLQARGFQAEYSGEYLETNAPPSLVFETALILGEVLRRTKTLYATRTAKKLILSLLVIEPSLQLSDIISRGESNDLLELDEDGKIHVKGDWRKALKSMIYLLGVGEKKEWRK